MNEFLEEHGEILVYGIVGIFLVVMVCWVCNSKWKNITPEYKTNKSEDNGSFIKDNKGKYPVIVADDIIYVSYHTKELDCKDFVKAKDYDGKDITDKVKIYGTVDTTKKGVYKLRCTVMSDNQLSSSKYINVIVE